MFRRISNSWHLVKASWSVLRSDKELILFPIASFFASIIVLATFAVPTLLADVFDSATGIPVLGYVIGFLFYAVMYFVVIFFNTALIGATMIRLKGGDPTLGDGLRIATEHVGDILGYAFISATVGMILQAIAERGILGQLVSSFLGFTWGVITFLVIPVLVVEKVGPIEGVKRSTALLKETWGEQLAGNFGIGTAFGALVTFVYVPISVLFIVFAVMTGVTAVIVTVAVLVALGFFGLIMVQSALTSIYTASVYYYAVTGETTGFDPYVMQSAFKKK